MSPVGSGPVLRPTDEVVDERPCLDGWMDVDLQRDVGWSVVFVERQRLFLFVSFSLALYGTFVCVGVCV